MGLVIKNKYPANKTNKMKTLQWGKLKVLICFCLQQNQKTALMRNTPFGSSKFTGYDF